MSTKQRTKGARAAHSPKLAPPSAGLVQLDAVEFETAYTRNSRFEPAVRQLVEANDPKQAYPWPIAEGRDPKMALSYAYAAVRKCLERLAPGRKFTVTVRIMKGSKQLAIALSPKIEKKGSKAG